MALPNLLPHLEYKDMIALRRLRVNFPNQFFTNVTNFFIQEMTEYIRDCRVWRIVMMGETRGGKSECATTIAMLYVNIFNQLLRQDKFKKVDVGKFINVEPLSFDISNVCSSQSNYVYTLREAEKNKILKFGQIWQIDENRENIGGLGTFSETLDLANINNIVAKFMQSELWLTPIKLQQRNAPYGLYIYQKDVVNRVNWALLYKIDMAVRGGMDYHFLGWVRIPLHHNEDFRQTYNMKKNEWIAKEIGGTIDQRALERKHAAKMIAEDKTFCMLTPSGKSFKFSKDQQIVMLEQYIIDGKTQRWNELEMYRIVDEARMIFWMNRNKEHMAELDA